MRQDRCEAHELNGGRIARTLGELKGAVMKVGQMASIAGDILPRELAEALRGLQREAPPVDFAVIAAQTRHQHLGFFSSTGASRLSGLLSSNVLASNASPA